MPGTLWWSHTSFYSGCFWRSGCVTNLVIIVGFVVSVGAFDHDMSLWAARGEQLRFLICWTFKDCLPFCAWLQSVQSSLSLVQISLQYSVCVCVCVSSLRAYSHLVVKCLSRSVCHKSGVPRRFLSSPTASWATWPPLLWATSKALTHQHTLTNPTHTHVWNNLLNKLEFSAFVILPVNL